MTMSSWYRNYFWNVKGNREYTRTGYEAAAAKFDPKDLEVDCTGRHIMITGGNKGIGLSTALQLARRGAVLHLVCRNMEDAKAARAQIVTDTGNDKVHLYHLDLSSPRDVMRFCDAFRASHDQLNVLINNAGVMTHERVLDADGIEFNFAVNTLATHLLTVGLMPIIQGATDGRVVMVSSAGMLKVRLDSVDLSFEKMTPFNGRLAYSQTKRQQVVLALTYAQNFEKVHFSSMHPGWADTLSVRTSIPQFYEMMKDKLRTPDQGADTIVWLAVSIKARTYNSGLFFQDREAVSTHLPLAWTRSTLAEESMFLDKLNLLVDMLTQPTPELLPIASNNGTKNMIPSINHIPADIPEESLLLKDQEEMEHPLQTSVNANENIKPKTSALPEENCDNSHSEVLINITKEERGEIIQIDPNTIHESEDLNIPEVVVVAVADYASSPAQKNEDTDSKPDSQEVDDTKSENVTGDVLTKSATDSQLSTITAKLESTKAVESSKESTVS